MTRAEPWQPAARIGCSRPPWAKGKRGKAVSMGSRQKRVRRALGLTMMATFPLPLTAQTPPPPQQQEEPILPDSEFEARLPKAGEAAADPGAPLPSIDEWLDRQMPQIERASGREGVCQGV